MMPVIPLLLLVIYTMPQFLLEIPPLPSQLTMPLPRKKGVKLLNEKKKCQKNTPLSKHRLLSTT
jgi:hypothetical protein